MTMAEKLVIIGSGPAGWTCAIYAARANLSPVVYEGTFGNPANMPMGQLNKTHEVENFPGFPKGVQGPELMGHMKEQAEHVGTRVVSELITSVDLSKRPFVLTDSNGDRVEAESIVICSGSPVMVERTMNNPKVHPHFHSVVDEVLGDEKTGLTGVRVKHVKTGETQTIDAAGMFVAIGHTPNTKFLDGQVQLDGQGFIKLLDPARSLTSVEGVFAAGLAAGLTGLAFAAAGFLAGAGRAVDCPRLLRSAAMRSTTLPRSGSSSVSGSIPSPLSLASITARNRVS